MTREDMLDCLHYELENLRVARGSDYSGVEAIEMAIKMLEAQELSKNSPKLDKENGDLQPTCNQLATDAISRKAAIDAVNTALFPKINTAKDAEKALRALPSAQPEPCEDAVSREAVTDVIRHSDIFSTWYEMDDTDDIVAEVIDEARKQLVDDVNELPSVTPKCPECDDVVSRRAAIDVAENAFVRGLLASPDIRKLPSVQPEPCEDAVSRDSVKFLLCKETCHPGAFCPDGFCREICEKVDALPSATPKQRMGEWIPVSERLPEEETDVLVTRTFLGCKDGSHGWNNHIPPSIYVEVAQYFDGEWTALSDEYKVARSKHTDPIAWMPLPEPYRAERRTD